MRTLILIMATVMIYTTPMTVEYTQDGYSILIDEEGDEWKWEQELPYENVTVLMHDNGTPEKEDDVILYIEAR